MRTRLRLTLSFVVLAAFGLALVGVVLYWVFAANLSASVDEALRSRADAMAGLEAGERREPPSEVAGLVDPDQAFWQLLGSDGGVLDASAWLGDDALVRPEELGSLQAARFLNAEVQDDDEVVEARLFAVPQADRTVLLVGSSLERRDDALSTLRALLLGGGPLALLLLAGAAWLVTGAALRPVERALARERRFVDDASHELRTPLGVLRTELELALRRPRSRDELEGVVRSALDESERLSRLAEDLLVVARTQDGGVPLRLTAMDCSAALDETVAGLSRPAAARQVQLEVACLPELVIQADPERLRQALTNMIDNAIRHSPPGGVVRVSADLLPRMVRIAVADEGPGFPADFLGDAFEPFARADAARGRDAGGTGLGLAIVRSVAEAHGGTARASNLAGSGAEVTLDLPHNVVIPG